MLAEQTSGKPEHPTVMNALVDLSAEYPLRINYWRGTSQKLVVVFSGVGSDPRDFPPNEFFRTATQNQENHALFVSDISRSWLNAPGADAQILDAINRIKSENDIEDVTLIGNSMGGTMALLLANQTPATGVVAFVPQYSVFPGIVPEETRWKRFTKHITDFKYKEIRLCQSPGQRIYVVHGGVDNELIHARRFQDIPDMRHFILPQYGHNLAKKLNNKKLLGPLISAAIAQRPVKFRRLIERHGGILRKNFMP